MGARAKKIKECDEGVDNRLLAFEKEVVKEGLKLKIEGPEDGYKVFMLLV